MVPNICEIFVDPLHRDPPGTACLILNGKGCVFLFLNPFPRSKKTHPKRNHGGCREFPHWDHRNGVFNKFHMNGWWDYGWWSSWPISSELRKPAIISLNSSIRWFTKHHLIESWNHLNQDSFNFNQLNLWIHFEVPSPFDSLGTTKFELVIPDMEKYCLDKLK